MAKVIAEITYDVSGAITALETLDSKSKQVGSAVGSSFKTAGGAANSFGDVLGNLVPSAGGALGSLSSFVSSGLNPVGLAAISVAGIITALTARFGGLSEVTKDSVEQLEKLISLERNRASNANARDSVQDAATRRGFEDAARASSLRRADIGDKRAEIDQKILGLQQQILSAERDIEQRRQAGADSPKLKAFTNELKDQVKTLQLRNREFRAELKTIGAEDRRRDVRSREFEDSDKAEDAVRNRLSAEREINLALQNQKTAQESVLNAGKNILTQSLIGKDLFQDQAAAVRNLEASLAKSANTLKGATPEQSQAAFDDLEKQQAALDRIQAEPSLGAGFRQRLIEIEKMIEGIKRARDATTEFASAGKSLNSGFTGQSADTRGGVPATRTVPQTAVPGALPGVAQTQQTINVNATVKGGIIDAETTRSITDIVRRELRRGTTPQTQAP